MRDWEFVAAAAASCAFSRSFSALPAAEWMAREVSCHLILISFLFQHRSMHTAHALLIGRLQDKKNLIGLIFLVFFWLYRSLSRFNQISYERIGYGCACRNCMVAGGSGECILYVFNGNMHLYSRLASPTVLWSLHTQSGSELDMVVLVGCLRVCARVCSFCSQIYFIFNHLRANLWHFCGCARIIYTIIYHFWCVSLCFSFCF